MSTEELLATLCTLFLTNSVSNSDEFTELFLIILRTLSGSNTWDCTSNCYGT